MRVAALVVLLLVVAGCAAPMPTWSDRAVAVLDGMADRAQNHTFDAFLVPYVVEAAARAGLDPGSWPPGHPVMRDWTFPRGNYLGMLRPLYALALANPGIPEDQVQVQSAVLSGFDGKQFGDAALLNDDAFAILALAAAGSGSLWQVHDAAAYIADHANATGGWSYAAKGKPDIDSTGIMLAALRAAGRSVDATPVVAYLASAQRPEGGYGAMPGEPANCDSTVWAIRGLLAFGGEVPAAAWSYLASLRGPDGYAYVAGGAANALCTVEVATLFAVAGQMGTPEPAQISFES